MTATNIPAEQEVEEEVDWITMREAAKRLGVDHTTLSRQGDGWGLTTWMRTPRRKWFDAEEVAGLRADRDRFERSRLILWGRAKGVMEFEDEDLLTTNDVAIMCARDRNTVCNWIKAGRVAFTRTPGGNARITFKEARRVAALVRGGLW